MQIFKSLILPMQGKNKGNLRGLCSSEKEDRVFYYKTLEFYFADTSYRNPEKLLLYLRIPSPFIIGNTDAAVVYEDYLLRTFSSTINILSLEYVNENKMYAKKHNLVRRCRIAEYCAEMVYPMMKASNALR